MANPNPDQRQTYNREVRQSDIDPNGNTHAQVTHTTESVNRTKVTPNRENYRDGYADGRVVERNYQQADLVERDNNNAARGLLLGILVTSLAAFTAGAIWFFNQRSETPTPVTAPVVVPDPAPEAAEPSPPPAASQPPERETTIIERETPVFVPVPQQQAPASPQPEATTPQSPAPPPPAAPAPTTQTAPSQPQTESNSTEPAMPSDPNAVMPDAGTSAPPSATPDNSSTPNDPSNQGSSTP